MSDDMKVPSLEWEAPAGAQVGHAELLAFERVAARMIGRRQQRVAIGRYRMREELGRGGFGAVYAAYDPELDREVALKLLLPRKGRKNPKWEIRLIREAQTLARLEHPNVVTVYDVGRDEASGGVYVVRGPVSGVAVRRRRARPGASLDFDGGAVRGARCRGTSSGGRAPGFDD